jgi:hypothetical protein
MPRPCHAHHPEPVPAKCHLCHLFTTRDDYRRLWESEIAETVVAPAPPGLGTAIETALTMFGVTSERVSAWLGVECNCKERRDKLDRLTAWAAMAVSGKASKGREQLESILQ